MNNIIREIQQEFNNHCLAALKVISVDYKNNSIVLSGRLKRYYHKAIATNLAVRISGNKYCVVNEIEVLKKG